MRNFKRFSLIALLALFSLSSCDRGDVVALADGGQVPFDHWDGRWLIINYWAEWCAPCRDEIPELNLMHAERASTGAVVLGVNYDALQGETLANLQVALCVRVAQDDVSVCMLETNIARIDSLDTDVDNRGPEAIQARLEDAVETAVQPDESALVVLQVDEGCDVLQ